jgi:large repetitive protein
VIDNSTDVPITGAVTGLDLQSGATAYAGVDVSGAHNGGNTAISAATVSLATAVKPVNDAPIASGSTSLPDISAANQHPPGETVATLFAQNFSDTADQQRTAINPTGSVANILAGVVVVGDTTPATDGAWRYSADGGTTWVEVPSNVSDINGLVLGSSVKLAFFPNPSFHGAPPPLLVRLIDNSSDIPVVGDPLTGAQLAGTTTVVTGVDVSVSHHGGVTSVSAAIVPVNVNVTAAGNPVFPPPSMNPFEAFERFDGGLTPGWLVGSIVYRSLTTEQPGTISLSDAAFYGSSSATWQLTYEAGTASGGPLPPWLSFDPATLTFTGVPPDSAAGALDLQVLARDQVGRQAKALVHVFVTRDAMDLLQLLRATRSFGSPEHRPTSPIQSPMPAPRGPMPGTKSDGVGRSGFTAQLREQTLAGRLSRTRAMLSALIETAA